MDRRDLSRIGLPLAGEGSTRIREEIVSISDEMKGILSSRSAFVPGSEWSDEDRLAIEDERVFIRRFWFDWPRSHRIAVIDLKRKREITDREIRILKWMGALRRDGVGVKLAFHRAFAVFGQGLAALIGAEYVLALAAAIPPHPLSLADVANIYASAGLVVLGMWLVHLCHVRPWRILCRIRELSGEDACTASPDTDC